MKQKYFLIIFSIFAGIVLFFVLLKDVTLRLYCIRQINVKIANFKSAAFRLGVIHIEEEEKYINGIKDKLLKHCLSLEKNEFVK